MPAARLAIYVDGANIDRASDELGIKIKYSRFKTFLTGTRTLAFANYYNSESSDPGERAFYHRLETLGFNVKLGPAIIEGRSQKEVDVQMAVDAVSDAYDNLFDIAVIASGDGDLAPVVRKLRAMIKPVEIASFHKQLSMSLLTKATRVIDLTSSLDMIRWV
jgi:uncharacterized LabA/DUF88 family protein